MTDNTKAIAEQKSVDENKGCVYCNMEMVLLSNDTKYQIDVWAGFTHNGKKIKKPHMSISESSRSEFAKFDINYCPICGKLLGG